MAQSGASISSGCRNREPASAMMLAPSALLQLLKAGVGRVSWYFVSLELISTMWQVRV